MALVCSTSLLYVTGSLLAIKVVRRADLLTRAPRQLRADVSKKTTATLAPSAPGRELMRISRSQLSRERLENSLFCWLAMIVPMTATGIIMRMSRSMLPGSKPEYLLL